MAKFNFNDTGDVKKLKETVNSIFESKIHKLELDSALNGLSAQPFGAIKNVFESITGKLYGSAEGKKLIGKYVKAIREGKNVSDAYSVYEFVYHSPNVSNPEKLLSEALGMAEQMDQKSFDSEKKNVADVVSEAVRFVGEDAVFVNECINKNYGVNRSIDYLMLNPKKFTNLDEYVNRFEEVKEMLCENMSEKPSGDAKKTGKELIDGLNESMEGLADYEKQAISDITLSKLSKRDMSELFEEYRKGCMEKLDENIGKEKSPEMKSRFESMRKQLSEKKYNESSLYEDIVTLSELKANLSA
jgi:hypothetical protein